MSNIIQTKSIKCSYCQRTGMPSKSEQAMFSLRSNGLSTAFPYLNLITSFGFKRLWRGRG